MFELECRPGNRSLEKDIKSKIHQQESAIHFL